MMGAPGLRGRQKAVIGVAGATRAASSGLLATALVVFVGREGSLFAVGMLATVFHLSNMLFAPIWGALGDLTGRRRGLLVGISAASTVLAFAFAAVDGVWTFVVLRGIYAVFVVGYGTLMLSLVGALGGSEQRGRAIGFFKSTTAVGNVVAKVLVGVFLLLLPPTHLFFLVGTLSLIATGILLQIEDPFRSPAGNVDAGSLLGGVRSRLVPDTVERARLRRTGLTWLYGGLALRHMAVKGVGSLVPIYLLAEVGTSEVLMGLLLALSPAAQIVLNPYIGRVVDRSSRTRVIVIGIAASGAYALILAAASLPVGMPAKIALAGSSFVVIAGGFAAMDVGVLAVIGDAVPATRESAFIGFRSTVSGFGGVIGPTLVGATSALAGYRAAFALMGLVGFAAALLTAWTVSEPDRPPSVPPERRSIETRPDLTRHSSTERTPDDH
jgi:MFS family permease